jgi:hypothetical protein
VYHNISQRRWADQLIVQEARKCNIPLLQRLFYSHVVEAICRIKLPRSDADKLFNMALVASLSEVPTNWLSPNS